MATSKLMKVNQRILESVTGVFNKIQYLVVVGYIKIEDGFVDRYLTKDYETIEEAKKRLQAKTKH